MSEIANQTKLVHSLPMEGEVIDNEDPLQLGRVKVKIPKVLDEDKDKTIWIYRKQSTQDGNSNDTGGLEVPRVGSYVEVQARSKSDAHTFSYGGSTLVSNKNRPQNKKESYSNYPHSRAEIDEAGNEKYVNKKTKTEHHRLANGIDIQTDGNGGVTINIPDNINLTLKDFNIKCKNINIECDTMDIKCSGEYKLKATNVVFDVPTLDFKGVLTVKGISVTG
jgi:hypothetical protein